MSPKEYAWPIPHLMFAQLFDCLHLEKLINNFEMHVSMNVALFFLGNFLRLSGDYIVNSCEYFIVLRNCGDISF